MKKRLSYVGLLLIGLALGALSPVRSAVADVVSTISGVIVSTTGGEVAITGLADQTQLLFGTGSDASIAYNTTQTPDSTVFALGADSNVLLLAEKADVGFDFAVPIKANPTLVIASTNQSTQQRLGIFHDGVQGRISDLAATATNTRPVGLWQGGAVTAAATITPTGNFFHVTGATGIGAVTVLAAGTQICMVFDSTPTVTENGTTLNMAGNLVATANDVLCLASDGTNWYETSRSVN